MIPAFPRRDKYELHVKEYWIDVRTTGEMKRTMSELTIRKFEVICPEATLPMPKLPSEPLPKLPEEDDAGADVAPETVESSDEENGQAKSKKKQAQQEAAAKVVAERKAQDAKMAEHEEILEDPHCRVWRLLGSSGVCAI